MTAARAEASVMPPAEDAGSAGTTPSHVWGRLAYGYAVLVAIGVGYFLFRMPFQLRDNLGLILDAQQQGFWETIAEVDTGYMRPLLGGLVKAVFELSAGHHFLAYKTFHAVQVGLLLVLFVRLLDVRSGLDFAVSTFATTVLVGMHTFNGTIREGFPINTFMTILVCCVAAVNLSVSRQRSWTGWAAVGLLVWAAFSVETGLLVWVCVVVGYCSGFRGISKRALVAMTGVVVLYFLLRFVILDLGTPALGSRPTGFGFSVLEPAELIVRFGDAPLMFYAYNIVCAVFSTLFSEPRAGVWAFTDGLREGSLQGWQIVNFVSSTLATVLIGRLIWTRWRRWVALDLEHGDRLALVFLGVLFGNAAISFPYSKDVIMSPAGIFYAVAAYVATRDLLQSARGRSFRLMLGAPVAVVLVVMSTTWCVRLVGNHYSLRNQAFINSADWTELDRWIEGTAGERRVPDAVALAERLREEARRKRVPNPYFLDRAAPEYVALFDPY